MQGPHFPTEDDEGSIPTAHVRHGPNLNHTFTVRRKAAKRTLPWDLTVDETQLALPRPQDEDIRETKRPRLEEPVPTSTDEATTKNTSHGIVVALPPPAPTSASADNEDAANTDSVMDMHTNSRTTGATDQHWTFEEDAELTSAVANSSKTKWGKKEYLIDWAAVATFVPGRTQIQCQNRWDNTLKLSIAGTAKRAVMWTVDEDIKLKHSVQMHGGKSWFAISALVPGRTKMQCMRRWNCCLKPSIDRATRHLGAWTRDEEVKLRHAVEMQDGTDSKDWVAIAALVPGRTKKQCWSRWDHISDAGIDRVTARKGKWKEDEDIFLKDAVQNHGGKDWAAITALSTAQYSTV